MNGAPHNTAVLRSWLDTNNYTNRYLDWKKCTVRSPDLTLLDCFLWGFVWGLTSTEHLLTTETDFSIALKTPFGW